MALFQEGCSVSDFLVPDKWQISGSDSVVEEVTAAARMANAPSNLSPEEAQNRKVALDMRALLCVNSSKGVFPNPTDEPSDPDFPDVDCDQVEGKHSPADLITRGLDQEPIDRHVEVMSVVNLVGRAESAPQVVG